MNEELIQAIQYDTFVMRQFKTGFTGTNLSKVDKDLFLSLINNYYNEAISNINSPILFRNADDPNMPFCKYLIFGNDDKNIKSSVMPIRLELYPYIRTAYSARTPEELAVLSRWVELPPGFALPMANYVVVILYSREQLLKEYEAKPQDVPFYLTEDAEYGIVAVLGTSEPEPEPMPPITMMRNALGMEEGGNGAVLNRTEYKRSVEFWDKNIMVK